MNLHLAPPSDGFRQPVCLHCEGKKGFRAAWGRFINVFMSVWCQYLKNMVCKLSHILLALLFHASWVKLLRLQSHTLLRKVLEIVQPAIFS